MKKFVYRALALMLCIILSVTALAEGVLMLPLETTVIRDEAFMGDTSMTEAVIPDGAKTIGERAFAYSALTDVVLPASLTEIADNAFEGCDGLVATVSRDSYAHQYCVDNNIHYRLMEELYSIAGLMREGANFRVTATTDETCIIQVEVLEEGSLEMLHAVHDWIGADLDYADVLVSIPNGLTFPSYYILRAVLMDAEGNELCEPFMTMQYTESYAQFDALTPEDFTETENKVVDFGDCGFGVVADGAITIPGTSSTDDHVTFVIPSDTFPRKGDVILVTLPDGSQEPVKVDEAVDNGDGTATVVRDEETVLSDLYKVFKLDGVADVGAAAQNNGVTRMQRAGDGGASTSLSTGFTYGAFSITGTGTAGVTVKAFYNAELFGEDYIEQQVYIDMSLSVKAKVSKAFKSSDIKDAFGNAIIPEFTVFEGLISLVGAGPIVTALQLKITVPLEFSFEAGGEYTMTITQKSGYSYTSNNGYTPIKEKDADHDFELKGSFNVQFGPKIELKAIVLLGILEGGVSGQVGVRAKGTASPNDTNATGSTVHGCGLCCDIDLSLFAEVKGSIVLKVTEKFKQNVLNVTLFSANASLGKAYISIINDEDSLFGGKLTFDFGKCPNYKYRVDVTTRDSLGSEVEGLPVTVNKEGAEKYYGYSPCYAHLYPGDYTAEAEFESGVVDTGFTVVRSACSVVVKEGNAILSGTVTDSVTGKPIADASVSTNLSEATTIAVTTDDSGYYELQLVPGIYTVQFWADGYNSCEMFGMTVVEGSNTLNMQLNPETATVRGQVYDADDGTPLEGVTVSAVSEDGTTVSTTTDSDGEYEIRVPEGECTIHYVPGSEYQSAQTTCELKRKQIYSMNVPLKKKEHTYQVFETSMTWSEAQAYCESLGGYLACITSAEEEALIESLIADGGKKQYWLGGYRDSNNNFVWVTGEPFSYSKWDAIEPNDYRNNESYVQILREPNPAVYGSKAYHWNDINNENTISGETGYFSLGYVGFICEWGY